MSLSIVSLRQAFKVSAISYQYMFFQIVIQQVFPALYKKIVRVGREDPDPSCGQPLRQLIASFFDHFYGLRGERASLQRFRAGDPRFPGGSEELTNFKVKNTYYVPMMLSRSARIGCVLLGLLLCVSLFLFLRRRSGRILASLPGS